MEDLNFLRWKRIKESEMPYTYIKEIIRENYGYEVRENSLDEFIENVKTYNAIDEGFLLSIIEEDVYKKLKIFFMKDLEKYDEHPIKETLSNILLKDYFKNKNRITIDGNEYYEGPLDNCYRVVKYKEYNNLFEIKLACVKNCIEVVTEANGIQNELSIDVYDSVKYVIDIENKLVFMFYNDIIEGNFKNNKEVTNRKRSFCQLFENVNSRNLINYELVRNLQDYFNDYIKEIEDGNIKKSISIIESIHELGEADAIKSTASSYRHSKKRIDAIKFAIDNEGHMISTLECIVNSNSIRIRHIGEIFLQDCTFQPEVMESVCKEFFRGYNPAKTIRECV